MDAASISVARRVSWAGEHGTVYGYFYPPINADCSAPADSLPPLITLSHGGPTGFTADFKIAHHQFWTSRGFAILDVNYGGSSGFGPYVPRPAEEPLGGSMMFRTVSRAQYRWERSDSPTRPGW